MRFSLSLWDVLHCYSAIEEKFLQHSELQPVKQMSKIQATQTSYNYEHANRFTFIEVENPSDHHVPAYTRRIQNILRQINSLWNLWNLWNLDELNMILLCVSKLSTILWILITLIFFKFLPNPHNTRGHSLKLTKQIFTSNSLSNNFVNRCVNCWNALPPSTVLSPTLSQFKNLLNKFDFLPFCVGERPWPVHPFHIVSSFIIYFLLYMSVNIRHPMYIISYVYNMSMS